MLGILFGCELQVHQTGKLRMPAGGFYPIVGMHSFGEAVRLLQKEPWQPDNEEEASMVVLKHHLFFASLMMTRWRSQCH